MPTRLALSLLISLFLGFMIAVTASIFVPALVQVPAPLLCDGDFRPQFSNRGGRMLCHDRATGATSDIGYARYAVTATLVWTGLACLPVALATLAVHGAARHRAGRQAGAAE